MYNELIEKYLKKLNKAERNESLHMTWGRIRTATYQLKVPRLIALVEKFNKDLSKAKIEEEYFKEVDK